MSKINIKSFLCFVIGGKALKQIRITGLVEEKQLA